MRLVKDSAIAGEPQPAASSAAHSPAGSVGQTSEGSVSGLLDLETGYDAFAASDPAGARTANHRPGAPWRMRFRLTANFRVLPATHCVSHRSTSPLLAQTHGMLLPGLLPCTITYLHTAISRGTSSNLPSAGVDIRHRTPACALANRCSPTLPLWLSCQLHCKAATSQSSLSFIPRTHLR
jgi:hypothetical protein